MTLHQRRQYAAILAQLAGDEHAPTAVRDPGRCRRCAHRRFSGGPGDGSPAARGDDRRSGRRRGLSRSSARGGPAALRFRPGGEPDPQVRLHRAGSQLRGSGQRACRVRPRGGVARGQGCNDVVLARALAAQPVVLSMRLPCCAWAGRWSTGADAGMRARSNAPGPPPVSWACASSRFAAWNPTRASATTTCMSSRRWPKPQPAFRGGPESPASARLGGRPEGARMGPDSARRGRRRRVY